MKFKKRKESDICCILSTNLMCWGFFYILSLFHIFYFFIYFLSLFVFLNTTSLQRTDFNMIKK